jgi:CBS-domain-containing membrane protein
MYVHKLPVRRRSTLIDSERASLASSVFCPLRGESVDVARCKECGHSDGVIHEGSRQTATLVCQTPDPPDYRDSIQDTLTAELTPVFEVMNRNVTCVELQTPVELVLELLRGAGTSGMPVVNGAGKLLGYVFKDDLFREPPPETLEQVMSSAVPAIPESSSLGRAAAYLCSRRVDQLVVVSRRSEVVGLLSAFDVAAWVARQCGYSVGFCSAT